MQPLSLAELTACSFERWYPSLRKHSIPSTVLPLTSDFVEYLKADGVAVAWGEPADDDDDGWGDEEVVGGSAGGAAALHGPALQSLLAAEDDEEAEAQPPAPRFPELEQAVEAAICKHGGAVLPKLNWSAPTDAAWMLGGSLRCTSPRDVLLLLKSSDRVAHDLCDARRLCESGAAAEQQQTDAASAERAERAGSVGNVGGADAEWVLVLRKWSALRLSSEFRCFRSGGKLIAACQRDRYSHYPFLAAERAQLLAALERFQREHLGGAPLPGALVWDAYIDASGRVYVVDVAPFHESTDPILFSWKELRELATEIAPEIAPENAPELGAEIAEVAAADGIERITAQASTVQVSAAAALRASQPRSPPTELQSPPAQLRSRPAELRLVEEVSVLPSANVYHGVPWDLQREGHDSVESLLAQASAAAQS